MEKIKLDLRLFWAYTEGYLSQTADILTEKEIESLPVGAAVITLELASRFLGDYLTGDRYFRIDYPEHNLVYNFEFYVNISLLFACYRIN